MSFPKRASFLGAFAVFSLSTTCLTGQVPADWPAGYPEWWYDIDPAYSVIDVSSLNDPGNHSPILQGQLLHMADIGIQELNKQLAPVGGAGFTIDDFRDSTKTPSYYSPATIGQLKFVASQFYNRFAEVGYQPGSLGWNPDIVLDEGVGDYSISYPWKDDQTPKNLSIALIGQAKHTFAWELASYVEQDSDSDAIYDFIEIATFGNLFHSASSDSDLDGFNDAFEIAEGLSPNSPYIWQDPVITVSDDQFEISNPNQYGIIVYSLDGNPIERPDPDASHTPNINGSVSGSGNHTINYQLFFNRFPVSDVFTTTITIPKTPPNYYMPDKTPLSGSQTIYYGRSSSASSTNVYSTNPSELDLGYVEVGYGILNSQWSFNPDYSPDSQNIYYGRISFQIGSTTYRSYIYSYLSSQLADRVNVGRGWLRSSSAFTNDYSEPSRKIYYGRKRYYYNSGSYTTKYFYSYDSSDLEDPVETGKGWLTSRDVFTSDKTGPSRNIYYGRKRYYSNSGSYTTKYFYSYDSGDLEDPVETGKGWLTSKDVFTPDKTGPSRNIYYGRKRYHSNSGYTTQYFYSYDSGDLEDPVETGKGWLTSKGGFTPDKTGPSRNIYYGRKRYHSNSGYTTQYFYSYDSGDLEDPVETGKGWLTSRDGYTVDYTEAPRSIYFGSKTYVQGSSTHTAYMLSHVSGQLSSPIYLSSGWITSLRGLKNASAVTDYDNDGLIDLAESQLGTSIYLSDTDSDGILDYDEVMIHGTDPLNWDTDGDTLMDGLEIDYQCLDPLNYNDPHEVIPTTGLSLRKSIQFNFAICGTSLDSDNDQIDDLLEVSIYGTDPRTLDSDQDGVSDGQELLLGLNPLIVDSDSLDTDLNHDGIDDSVGFVLGISLFEDDYDGDSLTNEQELALGTNPTLADTDGDGIDDGIDDFPLDPTKDSIGNSNSSDTSAPSIFLRKPPEAILL